MTSDLGTYPLASNRLGGLPTAHPAFTPEHLDPTTAIDDPSVLSAAVLGMRTHWLPITICLGGTRTLRNYSEWIVPREPQEEEDAYNRRIFHATMPPFLVRLASQAAGTILRKGIHLEGSDYWQEWQSDVTGDGLTLDEFARRLLISSLLYGHAATLVDNSSDPPPADLGSARARPRDQHPYLTMVEAPQIHGWRTVGNKPQGRLESVRYREVGVERLGDFGETLYEQIREVSAGSYRLWRRPLGRTNLVLPSGVTTGGWRPSGGGSFDLDELPLIPIYSNRIATLTSLPPLLEVAYLNIAYAQRFCDYHHSIHVGASPILALLGFDDAAQKVIGLSVNRVLLLPPDGDGKYIAPPSDCYDAQLKCMAALEDQISRLGINTLAQQNLTNAAAESRRLDRVDSDSIMAVLSHDLERSLTRVLALAARYANEEPPTVSIPQDYENRLLDGNQITAYLQLYMQGAITQETLLRILQLGEVLPSTLDISEEVEATRGQLEDQAALEARLRAAANAAGAGGVTTGEAAGGANTRSNTLPTPMRSGKHAE